MIKIDINRHMAKYDFDVAKHLRPTTMSGVIYHEEFQETFKLNALMEVFQECSDFFSDGQKLYQSLYTFDGQHIPSLDDIP
jgi:hypothetical protein